MKDTLRNLHSDTLFRNSFYLMLSTGVMAVLGFAFWLIAAKLFTPAEVGVATTLISAMNLLSYVGLLGFNSTFIRELPASRSRNVIINTGLTLSIAVTMVVSLVYGLAVPHIAPALGIIQDNIWYLLGFVVMVSLATVNLLTDSIFIALRAAKYNLYIDGILMSGVKLVLPFICVGLGAYGLFAASGAAAVLALIASVVMLIRKFAYAPRVWVDMLTLKRVVRYSSSNYIANLLNIAPTLVLPLIVINSLGASSAGYYYLSFMVASLLYTVVFAVTQSLFAEGSYAERSLRELLKKAVLFISAIVLPGAVVMYVSAPVLLSAFGRSYASEAATLLQVLALAAPAVCLYALAVVVLRITKQLKALITMNAVYFVMITAFAALWVSHGLTGVGYAWLIGNIISGLVGGGFIVAMNRAHSTKQEKSDA